MIRPNAKQSPDAMRQYLQEKRSVLVAAGSRAVLISDGTGDVLAILHVADIQQADDGTLLVRVVRA